MYNKQNITRNINYLQRRLRLAKMVFDGTGSLRQHMCMYMYMYVYSYFSFDLPLATLLLYSRF